MDICYVDESGDAGELLCLTSPTSTPVVVIAGVIVPSGQLMNVVWDFLSLKKETNPQLRTVPLSALIATEVKGADLRSDIRSNSRRRRRRATRIIDKTLGILESHGCMIVGRVLVKDVDVPLEDRAAYGSSVGWLCRTFHVHLEGQATTGLVVLDSRNSAKNAPNSHTITTQKFRSGGDPLPRLNEIPVFGHSDCHVALQIADIVASAVIYPAACTAYCRKLTWNHHAHQSYKEVAAMFGDRLKRLQFRYFDQPSGQWRGGLFVTGSSGSMPSRLLFGSERHRPLVPEPAVDAISTDALPMVSGDQETLPGV